MKIKNMIIAIMVMMFFAFGTANASHYVDEAETILGGHGNTSTGQAVMAGVVAMVMYDAISTSNAQGVLPCHSKPDVKIDKGGYVVYATDCEVNGFK